MDVVIGIAIILYGVVVTSRLARWAGSGRGQLLPPSFIRIYIFTTVWWGTFMGGLAYARWGSALRWQGLLLFAVGSGAVTTLALALITLRWRARRPLEYAFAKAWAEAHSRHGVQLTGRWGRPPRWWPVLRQYRERWQQEGCSAPAVEFIDGHWDQIVAAESG